MFYSPIIVPNQNIQDVIVQYEFTSEYIETGN